MNKLPQRIEKKITEARRAVSESIDGYMRPEGLEDQINVTCRNVLNGPEGEYLMDYLKSITTSMVMPPSASDAELRMQEGMRRVVAILDTRRKTKPKESPKK